MTHQFAFGHIILLEPEIIFKKGSKPLKTKALLQKQNNKFTLQLVAIVSQLEWSEVTVRRSREVRMCCQASNAAVWNLTARRLATPSNDMFCAPTLSEDTSWHTKNTDKAKLPTAKPMNYSNSDSRTYMNIHSTGVFIVFICFVSRLRNEI